MATRSDMAAGAARAGGAAADWLFIPHCVGCDTLWPKGAPFCVVCEATLLEVEQVCPTCSRPSPGSAPCPQCRASPPSFRQLIAPFWYGGEIAVALRKLKFYARTDVSRALASLLEIHARRAIRDCDAVIPVPLHWRRQLRRGFNQAELIAWDVAPGQVQSRWLRRVRATRPQTELTSAARRENMTDAFAPSRHGRKRFRGKRIVLVDDVVTTGATLEAATRAILDAGAVDVVVFAAARVEL